MDRERVSAFAVAAAVLTLAVVALVAVDQSRDHTTSAPSVTAPGVEVPPATTAPARPVSRPRATVATIAHRFAGDWLDYLAGRRPASAVRGADASLLVAFAGGGQRDPIGPGRRGLRTVRCARSRGERRDCRAIVTALPAIRFTLTTRGRPRVIALALD